MRWRIALAAGCMLATLWAQETSLAVSDNLHAMVYRYLTEIAQRDLNGRDARIAAIHAPAEVVARQQFIRAKMTELLGGFPERTPLNPRITGRFARDGYRVEKLIFESRPKLYVTADVYVPTGGSPPYPAIVGVAGHSDAGKAYAVYQHGWIGLAKRGYLVIAFDPPGQGERMQFFDPELGRSRIGGGTTEHTSIGLQCILTGSNIANYVIWDGIRAVDYLLTRPDVDAKRIGVAGNSGGGTQSAYLAALEPRLASAAPSCYLTTSEKLWTDLGPQDAEQNIIGFLAAGLDLKDFAFAFAPRPFEFLTATRDFFPIAGARAAFDEARHIYEIMGHPERVNFFEFDDTHGWSQPRREATYRWFQRWLNGHPEDEGVEPVFDTEPEENLSATPTGQLETSLRGETVQSLNAKLAEEVARTRPALRGAALQNAITQALALPAARMAHPPEAVRSGEVKRDGYHIEKLMLATEVGIQIPVLMLVPDSGDAKKPAVLYLNPDGKAADAAPGRDMEALVRAGRIVLAPDLRAWGETSDNRKRVLTPHYSIAMRAMLVGRSLPGMQVTDLLSAFYFLSADASVDPGRVAIFAKGNAGPAALLAAALEPAIRQVAWQGGPISYLDIVKKRFHGEIADIVIPGVLKQFDLPDVAAALVPRTVWIIDPRMPDGGQEAPADVEAAYAQVEAEYRRSGHPKQFRIVRRPEGWSFAKVYADWLAE